MMMGRRKTEVRSPKMGDGSIRWDMMEIYRKINFEQLRAIKEQFYGHIRNHQEATSVFGLPTSDFLLTNTIKQWIRTHQNSKYGWDCLLQED
jgi:hypothetical protein